MLNYVLFDVVCVVIAILLIVKKDSFSFYHPGFMLLFYHIFNNSFRFFGVYNGGSLLFDAYRVFDGATHEELMRAMFWADIALLATAVAIYFAERRVVKPLLNLEYKFDDKFLYGVLAFTVPIGIWGAYSQLYIPSLSGNIKDLGSLGESSYIQMTQSWFGVSMLGLIYFKGFKKRYMIPLIIYLLIIAMQGYHRYRLVLPSFFLIVTYLVHYKKFWPTRQQFVLLMLLGVLFYPLKYIGYAVQQGKPLSEVINLLEDSAGNLAQGDNDDQKFFDQYAITLTEVDNHDALLLGETYLPLLTLPIPRQLWPEKPKLNDWVEEISSKSRPFDEIGMISTIYGEGYANFSYPGLVLTPAILFYFLVVWYRKVLDQPRNNLSLFFYIIVYCSMIQVMRDGLTSLFMFPVLQNLPLFMVFLLHKVFAKRQISVPAP